jgi:hypothetical protein
MGKPNFSDEFKCDAVAQITERGYPVAEVSQRLGVSQHLTCHGLFPPPPIRVRPKLRTDDLPRDFSSR